MRSNFGVSLLRGISGAPANLLAGGGREADAAQAAVPQAAVLQAAVLQAAVPQVLAPQALVPQALGS